MSGSWPEGFARRSGKKPDSRCRTLLEGRLYHKFFAQFATWQVSDDSAIAKHIDLVSLLHFFHLRCGPQKGSAGASLGTDEVIDLQLGVHIYTAHGVVHHHDLCLGTERAREQR